jgi:glycoside/pentoside/hexuronide:cation symporter, GPH family
MNVPKKMRFTEKAGYALGDTAANIAWRPLMSFLPIFYTNVAGLPLAAVSLLLFVTRFSDGITDIIMGTIADRTKTRWGKFRPWLLWTAVPFGLLIALTFTSPNWSYSAKLTWAYVTYILFTLVYTMNNVPYSALMGVMSSDVTERNILSSYRFFGAYLGGAISLFLIPILVKYIGKGDENMGYQYTMYLLAGLMILFTLITFFTTQERVYPKKQQNQALLCDFKDLITNRPWVILLFVGFLFVIYNSIKQGVTIYYFKYYLNNELLTAIYLPVLVIVSMVSAFIAAPLANFFGKKQLFIYVMFLSLSVNALLYFAGNESVRYVFIVGCISEFFIAIVPVLFFSMLADAADYSEWKNGRRATGLVFSAGTFAMKFGGGVAGAVMLFIMQSFGYDGKSAVQSESALQGIKLNMSLVPGVFLIIAIGLMALYTLSKTKMAQIESDLVKQRAE